MHDWSCGEIASRVRAGDVSAEEVISHSLARIESRPELNAMITVDAEQMMVKASSS